MYHKRDQGIVFREDGNDVPVAFYDASNKPEPIKGRRQYGYCIVWKGGPVMWASKKHKLSTTSAPMSEYMALGECCRAVRWFRRLVTEMGFIDNICDPTPVLGDNDGATQLSREDLVTPGNRHILDDYHLAKEMVARWEVDTKRVDTSENRSDLFTKCVTNAEHHLEDMVTGQTSKPLPEPTKIFRTSPEGEKKTLAYMARYENHRSSTQARSSGVSGFVQDTVYKFRPCTIESITSAAPAAAEADEVTHLWIRWLLFGAYRREPSSALCI